MLRKLYTTNKTFKYVTFFQILKTKYINNCKQMFIKQTSNIYSSFINFSVFKTYNMLIVLTKRISSFQYTTTLNEIALP